MFLKKHIYKAIPLIATLLLVAYGSTYFALKKQFHHLFFNANETENLFFYEKMKNAQLEYERITLPSDYGTVEACIVPSKSENNIWIIFLQNANKLYFSEKNLWRYRVWHYLGTNTIAPNYIRNEEIKLIESPEKLYQTALVTYNYLVYKLNIPPEKILFYGEGVGAYAILRLASEVNVAGIIIENGFLSLRSYLQDLFPILKVSWVAPSWLEVEPFIKQLNKPILFFNALQDEIFPSRHTQQLYEKTISVNKKIVTLKKNLQQIKEKDGKTYQKAIADFLKELKLRNL